MNERTEQHTARITPDVKEAMKILSKGFKSENDLGEYTVFEWMLRETCLKQTETMKTDLDELPNDIGYVNSRILLINNELDSEPDEEKKAVLVSDIKTLERTRGMFEKRKEHLESRIKFYTDILSKAFPGE